MRSLSVHFNKSRVWHTSLRQQICITGKVISLCSGPCSCAEHCIVYFSSVVGVTSPRTKIKPARIRHRIQTDPVRGLKLNMFYLKTLLDKKKGTQKGHESVCATQEVPYKGGALKWGALKWDALKGYIYHIITSDGRDKKWTSIPRKV